MNTPAHVVLNATVLGRRRWRTCCVPITVGALLPDMPMVFFYLYERAIIGASERAIWSRAYFAPGWQGIFNASHSFPLIGAAALIAWALGAQSWLALTASMALHSVADLPLHNNDAHAHFFPLSSWRFHSPISYWDPHHHGTFFLLAEVLLVIGGSIVLLRRSGPRAWRILGTVILVSYVALLVLAIAMWGPA